MTPKELLELFRKEADDTTKPYLWSDEEFYYYLNEAQDLHVRLVGGIADRRSPLTKVTYKTGDQFRKYDERILRIKGAFDESNNILTIRNLDNFESGYLEDDYGQRLNVGLEDGKTGDIKYLVTDVETGEFQLYPIPDHEGWIRLYVYRLPLEEVTASSELEIPTFHHLNLLNWVKHKAYMKQDVEAFNMSKATDFRAAFSNWIVEAKKEKSSREDRKRTVSYGGIPMR
jgi:hypothetical protein